MCVMTSESVAGRLITLPISVEHRSTMKKSNATEVYEEMRKQYNTLKEKNKLELVSLVYDFRTTCSSFSSVPYLVTLKRWLDMYCEICLFYFKDFSKCMHFV